MSANSKPGRKQVIGLFGVGFDHADGHKRFTRNEDFLIVGGSKETHEQMQDVSIRFNESLRERGKPLHEADADEVADLLRDALED